MKTLHALCIAIVVVLSPAPLYSQEKSDSTQRERGSESVAVKELDEFHELLHPLVHDAYPNKDFAAIRKAIPGLKRSAKLVRAAVLPKELAPAKHNYKKESRKLLKQLTELDKRKNKLSDEELGMKFMEMHDTFEELMGIVR